MPDQSPYQEVLQVARDWSNRTELAIRKELRYLKIGYKKELYPSIHNKVLELAASKIGIDLSFLTYGRYVDMGAGPGSPQDRQANIGDVIRRVENADSNRAILTKTPPRKARVPKKFYSRVFYARLNALLGVVSGSMIEEAVRTITANLSTKTTPPRQLQA